MQITKLIIHEVQRQIDNGTLNKVKRPTLNSLEALDSNVQQSLIRLFVNANLTIGGFGLNGDHNVKPAFEQRLETYIDANTDIEFVSFTHNITDSFEAILNERSKQTVKGGYLVFYEYSYLDQNWLAVVILNKTLGIDVTQELDVIPRELLDVAKLHIGATINLTKWESSENERYIKFRTGTASEVRDYFERLIGCQRDQQAIKVETQQLRETIESFALNNEIAIDQVNNILSEAYKFIYPRISESQPILLTELINHIFPDKVNDFFDYIHENDIDISEDISIDKATLNSFKRYSARWNDINLTFSRNAIGNSLSLRNRDIILNNAPEWLIEDIRKILPPEDTE